MKLLLVFILIIAVCSTGLSQLSYDVQHLTYSDGQALGYTRDVYQDTTGLIWISSTIQGLHTYDGNKITTHHLGSESHYFPLKEGVQFGVKANGNLLLSDWGYTSGTLYEYNLYERSLVDSIMQTNPSKKRIYDFIIDHNDRTWAVSDPFDEGNYVYLFLEKTNGSLSIIDTFPINTFLTLLNIDEDVLVTAKESIRRYNATGDLVKTYQLEDGTKEVFPFVVTEDEHGNIYVKTDHSVDNEGQSNALFLLNKEKDKFEILREFREDVLDNSRYITFFRNELWIAGWQQNLHRIDLEKNIIEDYSAEIRTIVGYNFYVNGVFKDESGVCWVTTSKGLLKLVPKENKKVTFEIDDKSSFCDENCNILSAVSDESTSYFSYLDRLVAYDKNSESFIDLGIEVKDKRKGTQQSFIWDLGSDRLSLIGDYLVWNDLLIDRKDYSKVDLIADHTDFRVANQVINDSIIWLAPFYPESTYEFLYTYNVNSKKLTNISPELDLQEEDVLTSIYVDELNNCIWIGSRGLGILKFDQEGNFLDQIERVDDANGREIGFYCFHSDPTGLWVGTRTGIVKVDSEHYTLKYFPAYMPSDQGFHLTSRVFSMIKTSTPYLWIGAQKGIHRFNMIEEKFDTPELPLALKVAETTVTSPQELKNGEILFGTLDGLIKFNPDEITEIINTPYDIIITSTSKFDTKEDKEIFMEGNINDISTITFDYRALWFSLEYMLPYYRKSLLYSHRLLGFEDTWSIPSKEGKLRYTKLPPGNYTLELRAGVDVFNLDKSNRQIKIVVKQAWFTSWWFYLSCILFVTLITFLIVRYRYRLKLKSNEEIQNLRTKISSDLHDDVGSILTGISMHSEVLSKMTEGKVKKSFNKLSSESRNAIESMRDIVWALDSRKDKFGNLIDRMKSFAHDQLSNANISYDFVTDDVESSLFINPQKRQQVYFIFKEAVTNIVKHADATKVLVKFRKKGKSLALSIHDNGVAQSIGVTSDGLGLTNMKMRAKKIGAECVIKADNGFKIEILGI